MSTGASGTTAVVVGAGIVGSACAMYLTKAGIAVTIVDAGFPAGGATSAGMGHLVVMDDSDAQFSLTSYSLELWRELASELGDGAETDTCGTLWLAADDEEMDAVRQKAAYYRTRGVDAGLLDRTQLREAEPILSHHLHGGLHVPGDAVIYPPLASVGMLEIARRGGARLMRDWPVDEIGDNRVSGTTGTLTADIVINAAGMGAPLLTPEIALLPRKGHLVITDRYPSTVRHQLVELGYLKSAHTLEGASVAFNIQPRKTGQLLVGSSRELGMTDLGVDTAIVTRMLDRASAFVPKLGSLRATRVWTGIRPATSDKLPLIGPSSRRRDVWIAAGHEGLGITTSLGTARILVDMITGRDPAIDASPFSPSRRMAALS